MVTISIGSTLNSKGLDQAQRELDSLKSKAESASGKFSKAGSNIATALSAIGGAVAGFAIDQTMKLEDANAQLGNAFKNAGTSLEQQKGALDKVQTSMEKYGYSNAQTAEAVGRMTTVTGDAKKSMHLMGLAADIAKNRHLDLTKAGDLLAKTLAGSTTAAKKMGIAVPDSVSKIQDPAQKSAAMLKILQGHFKGSADAAAGTFAGKMETAKAKVGDAAAKIGEKLVPMVMKLVDALMKVGDWLSKHKEVMIGIAIAIGLALAVMTVQWVIATIAAMSFWTAATGGIIILVAALAAGIIWIVTHWHQVWHTIKHTAKAAWKWVDENVIQPLVEAFKKAWGAIKGAFKAVWDWLKNNWPLLLAIITGPIGLAVLAIKDHWKTIKGFFSKAIDWFTGIFSSIGDAIWAGIKWGLNKAIEGLNTLIHAANNVTGLIPGVGSALHIPDIPKLARGGSVSAGNPYIVGDGGGPELFVPSQSGTIVPSGKFSAGGTNHVTINVHGADPQLVVNALRTWMMRNGSLAGAGIR